jgi:hypothetical protein
VLRGEIVGNTLDRLARRLKGEDEAVFDLGHSARIAQRIDDHVRRLNCDRKHGGPPA